MIIKCLEKEFIYLIKRNWNTMENFIRTICMDGVYLRKKIKIHRVLFMKEVSVLIKNMEMANISMMDKIIIIMENGKMIKKMEKEYISSLMEFIMANGKIIKCKAKEHLNLIMDINIKVSSKMETLLKDLSDILMAMSIQVLFSTDKDMVRGLIIHTNHNRDIKDNGVMIKNTEKVYLYIIVFIIGITFLKNGDEFQATFNHG
jgi:hypothetical protein